MSTKTLDGVIDSLGPYGSIGSADDAAGLLTQILSTSIGIITVIAFIWFAFKLMIGAVGIVNSGGDKAKIAEARNNITYGVIGVVVVVAGIFIAELVAYILGIENILNIQAMVTLLSP